MRNDEEPTRLSRLKVLTFTSLWAGSTFGRMDFDKGGASS